MMDNTGDNVDRAVRACTNELTGDQSFSQTEIVVEYHDTKVVPLTLVDLPVRYRRAPGIIWVTDDAKRGIAQCESTAEYPF